MIQWVFSAALLSGLGSGVAATAELEIGHNAQSVLRSRNKVVLQSASFSFHLDIADGLRAELWENRLTGRKLAMGHGLEAEFDIGLPGRPLATPRLTVVKAPAAGYAAGGEAVFQAVSQDPKALVTVSSATRGAVSGTVCWTCVSAPMPPMRRRFTIPIGRCG
jgi:hypothetical protein